MFRKDGSNSFKLVIEANDPSPISVEYISFATSEMNSAKFFFNCSFSLAKPETVSNKAHPPITDDRLPSPIALRNRKLIKHIRCTSETNRKKNVMISFPFSA